MDKRLECENHEPGNLYVISYGALSFEFINKLDDVQQVPGYERKKKWLGYQRFWPDLLAILDVMYDDTDSFNLIVRGIDYSFRFHWGVINQDEIIRLFSWVVIKVHRYLVQPMQIHWPEICQVTPFAIDRLMVIKDLTTYPANDMDTIYNLGWWMLPFVEVDVKKIVSRVIERARELCISKSFESLGALGISGVLLLTSGGIAWHAIDVLKSFIMSAGGINLGLKFLDSLAGIIISGMILKAGLEIAYQRWSWWESWDQWQQ
ncbi:Metal tolerance protein 2 [Acorus calamus]|uniref:Metal tolerance protein 2 n=1 Tax=Acorus calamus TaxID=4465 RepID=A0AAV9FIN1_ACOCL|nr:Metal tolerance protein 2 [Acorus calamus]